MSNELFKNLTEDEIILLEGLLSEIRQLNLLPQEKSVLEKFSNEKGALENIIRTASKIYAHNKAKTIASRIILPPAKILGSALALAFTLSLILFIVDAPTLIYVWEQVINGLATLDPSIAVAVTVSILAAFAIASLGAYFGVKQKSLNTMRATVEKVRISAIKEHLVSKAYTRDDKTGSSSRDKMDMPN